MVRNNLFENPGIIPYAPRGIPLHETPRELVPDMKEEEEEEEEERELKNNSPEKSKIVSVRFKLEDYERYIQLGKSKGISKIIKEGLEMWELNNIKKENEYREY